MPTQETRFQWQLFLKWIVATFVGTIVGFFAGVYLIIIMLRLSIPDALYGIIPFAAIGATMGWFQWLVLRSKLAMSSLWVWMTLTGMMVTSIIFFVVESFFKSWPEPLWSLWVFYGAVIGMSQWLMLRHYLNQSILWLLANILGMFQGAAWSRSVQVAPPADLFGFYALLFVILLRVWIVYSIITGILLMWMMRQNPVRGIKEQPIA